MSEEEAECGQERLNVMIEAFMALTRGVDDIALGNLAANLAGHFLGIAVSVAKHHDPGSERGVIASVAAQATDTAIAMAEAGKPATAMN